MPARLPVNCDSGTCRNLALPGKRYCELHHKEPVLAESKQAGERLRNQNEPWRRWYHTAHWKNLRTLVLARDPICKECNRNPSTVADHIKPHKGVWSLFVDMNNLAGKCKPCHDKKTATEDGGFGSEPKNENTPAPIGEPGKLFTTTSVGKNALDRALEEEI